ncbi:MAG: outer membrane receptor for ferrienterochelin and colicin [Myxococcota bacterium]|jgi:outer membrane receptor for ferrienterochelin and colicin
MLEGPLRSFSLKPWAVAAALFLVAAPAHAGPKDDARRHFAAGLEAARDGNFEIALQRFLAAQEAYSHPVTLYNIARAYADLKDTANALTYYKLYREAAPDRAADVDPVIAALESRLGGTSAPAADTGGRPVMVGGPSEEELARLRNIAAELAALTDAFSVRATEDAAAAGDDPTAEAPPSEEPLPSLPESDFLTDAYDRVVVTASRVGQDPLDSPSTLSVITADDIRLSGAVELADVLRRVVGVDLMQLSAGYADVAIRGFNRKMNNKVLILIDGRSTYMDFIGVTFIQALPVALEEIERIEIVRGPGSAVYGANAVTGVINIITRTPGDEPGGIVHVDGGTPGLGRGVVTTSGRAEDTAWRFAAQYQQHGRWAKEPGITDADGEVRDNLPVTPFFENQNRALTSVRANGRIDRSFGEDTFASISGGWSETSAEFYNFGALENFGINLRHHYLRGDVFWKDLHLRTFWNSDSGETAPWLQPNADPRAPDPVFDNDAVDVLLEYPVEFATGSVEHQFLVGTSLRHKRIRFDYLAGGLDTVFVENHGALFLNEQATIGRLGVVASLRADRHPLIALDKTISPRGALLYRLFDETSLRATAGTAFRAPNSLESYMDFALTSSTTGVYIRDLGDQDTLLPERIATFELGVHDESTYFHQADAVVYYNRVSNLIDLRSVEPTLAPFDPQRNGFEGGETGWYNRSDTVYDGIGFELEGSVFPTDGLDLFANVAVAQVLERDTKSGTTVLDGSSSTAKLNAGLAWLSPWRTDLSLSTNYLTAQTWRLRQFDDTGTIQIAERPVAARVLLNTRVAVRPFADEQLELAVTGWNLVQLFGEGFVEHPEGQPVRGRAFGSATYRF